MAPLPGPVSTRPLLGQAGPLYLPARLFLPASVRVTISSSSQGEQRRSRHQLCVIERGRRGDGRGPVDACHAHFGPECLPYYIRVRKNGLALIKMKSLTSLFTDFNHFLVIILSYFLIHFRFQDKNNHTGENSFC